MAKVLGTDSLAVIRDWVKSKDNAVKEELRTLFGSPLVASTVAGMTDHDKVYVYTGSETNYTSGNWYYWNGTAWTSGGVYNSSAVNTDTTLTVSGVPADAKAVGDALKADIAPAYSSSSTYSVGQYVLYNNALYKCKTAISTAENWTAAHWTAVNVGGELTHYKQDNSKLIDRTIGFKEINGYLRADNKWAQSTIIANSVSYLIAVNPSCPYWIRSTNTCVGAFLKSIPDCDFWANNTDMSDHYATGASRTTFSSSMTPGTTPSDAKYLVISQTVNGSNWSPTLLTINGYDYLKSALNNIYYRARNNLAYVAENSFSWTKSGSYGCAITFGNSLIIRDALHVNAVEITASQILSVASAASGIVTVSDGVISGSNFIMYYDFTAQAIGFCAVNTPSAYTDRMILWAWYYASYRGGVLFENTLSYVDETIATNIADIQTRVANKLRKALAYVSSNGISWEMTSTTNCALTFTAGITIRDITHYSSAIAIQVNDLLTIAGASSVVTVSDGVINGTNFALIYNYTSSSFEFVAFNAEDVYAENTLILFAHYYASYTGGMLVDAYSSQYLHRINAIESKMDSLPTYTVPDYLSGEVTDTVDSLISASDEKAMLIAFTTDNHYGASDGQNWPITIGTIKAINDKYKLDAIIDGGDMINGDETVANAQERLRGMIADMNIANVKNYATVGNHDDDSFGANPEVLLDEATLYALVGRPIVCNFDNANEQKTYGYKDFDSLGIRLIMLDSRLGDSRTGEDPLNWGYDTDQISWVENVALDTDKQVVFFSHMGLTKEYAVANYQPVNGDVLRGKIETFISGGGVVIGFFHGHTHWDFIGQKSQTNGFHEVSTGCGRVQHFTPSYAPEGATVPTRTSGTVTQELYDVICIKPGSREVDIIRFGAGNDRSFTY